MADHANPNLPGPVPSNEAAPAHPARLHWIDWLRVAAIASVFVFHTLRPFNTEGWHVKNDETSGALTSVMILFWSFGLAVLFLLSGAGARFALSRRSWRTFLRERTTRLLVPFVAGMLLLSPVQGFIEATHKGAYAGSFPDYVVLWLAEIADPVAWALSPTVFGKGYHLWFLGFLFAISVISLPLLEGLRGARGRRAVDALARAVAWPGATLAFAVPIWLLMTVGVTLGTDEHSWFEFAWYSAYFVVGFVLISDGRFMTAVRRELWPALGVAVVSTFLIVATPVGGLLATMQDGLDGPHLLAGGVFALEGWAWTLVVLNIGLRVAQLQRPVGGHLGEAVLPVYVIHQPVILAVAFFVVQWPLGILPKWLVVLGVSTVMTLALVELALRTTVTRFLVGARTRPAEAVVGDASMRAGSREPGAGGKIAGTRHARPR